MCAHIYICIQNYVVLLASGPRLVVGIGLAATSAERTQWVEPRAGRHALGEPDARVASVHWLFAAVELRVAGAEQHAAAAAGGHLVAVEFAHVGPFSAPFPLEHVA